MQSADLGFLLARLLRVVIAAEEPILERAGLQMWDYVVLAALGDGHAPTQAHLATVTGRDKTRLIGNLDRLEQRGLVVRTPDPRDRRNRVVALTSQGKTLLRRCRTAIRAREAELFGELGQADQAAFEQTLVHLIASGRNLGWADRPEG